jgi:hypothetical protein
MWTTAPAIEHTAEVEESTAMLTVSPDVACADVV